MVNSELRIVNEGSPTLRRFYESFAAAEKSSLPMQYEVCNRGWTDR